MSVMELYFFYQELEDILLGKRVISEMFFFWINNLRDLKILSLT